MNNQVNSVVHVDISEFTPHFLQYAVKESRVLRDKGTKAKHIFREVDMVFEIVMGYGVESLALELDSRSDSGTFKDNTLILSQDKDEMLQLQIHNASMILKGYSFKMRKSVLEDTYDNFGIPTFKEEEEEGLLIDQNYAP
jgi:hypothetical protein